jgi:recombination protein RecA
MVQEKEQPRYKTGCTLLDLAVGGAKGVMGFQGGKWVNLVGDASSGKSLLCLETIVANKYKYKDDFQVTYDDTENGFTFDAQDRYGFSIKPDGFEDSETVEEMSCQFTKFLTDLHKNDKGIYVIDSLDGLADASAIEMDEERQKAFEKDKELDKGSMQMGLQKFLSQQYFKTKHGILDDSGALCFITSQVRQNVGAGLYGPKWVRAGGKAMDLYANYIIWLKTLQIIEKDGRKIGAVVHAKITKAKVQRPYREIVYTVLFDYGIDDVGSNLCFLFDLRSEKTGEMLKRAQSIVWEDGMEPMDYDTLIKYIEDKKLKKALQQRVIDKWEAIEDAVATKRPFKYEEE